ncbi:hypothetical protein GCM10028796_13910 [Ramlibacter monticola]
MDPLSARLLLWIGVSLISLGAAAVIIVAEMRDHARLYGEAGAFSPMERWPAEPMCLACDDPEVAQASAARCQPTRDEP